LKEEGKEMKNRQGGFTLIELLVAILISGIVLAALYTVFISQEMAFSNQEQVAEMNQNIRAALDLMTREIRLAGYKTSTSTFNGIQTATATSIGILADLDQNGDTLGTNENVTYSYNAGTLQIFRNSGTSVPVADNITSLSFVYTLKNGTTTSTPSLLADIRKVAISITARTTYPDRATGTYRTISLTTDVTPRNLAL
jgi:type IV pilus assembly protein PilW